MKKLTKISALSLMIFGSAVALVTSTVAWFKYGVDITFGDGQRVPINAGAEAAYFGGGDGSQNNPYVISNRTHLYNLAWLQYIGMFNVDNIEKANPEIAIQDLFFKVVLPEGETELDMDNLTLPPIGTETYPFYGHFDGQGYTISNLKISNDNPVPVESDFGITKPSDIPAHALKLDGESHLTTVDGLFGVVGSISTNEAIQSFDGYHREIFKVIDPDTGEVVLDPETEKPVTEFLLSDYEGNKITGETKPVSIVPSIQNVTLENLIVKSGTNNGHPTQLLIGFAAGYLDGEMSNVKVSGTSKLIVNNETAVDETLTSKLSDYGLVGYTESVGHGGDYTQKVGQYYDSELEAQGKDNAWGGSVDMHEAFTRLTVMRNKATGNNNNEVATDITATYKKITKNGTTSRTRTAGTTVNVRHYPRDTDADYGSYIGNYVFTRTGETNGNGQYSSSKIYMGGGTYETDEIFVPSTGYYITDGTHYLSSALGDTTNAGSLNNTYRWQLETLDGTGYIRCYDETATGGDRPRYIYLQYPASFSDHQGTLATTTTPGTRTNWAIKKEGTTLQISCASGSTTYRLYYISGTGNGWKLYEKDYVETIEAHTRIYYTTSGTRYYLPRSVLTTNLTNTNTAGVTTEQVYLNTLVNNQQVSLYDVNSPGTTYYLYANCTSSASGNSYTVYPTIRAYTSGNAPSGWLPVIYHTNNTTSGYFRTDDTFRVRTGRTNQTNYTDYYVYLRGNWRATNSQTVPTTAVTFENVAAQTVRDYSGYSLTIANNAPYDAADIYSRTDDPKWNYNSDNTTYFPLKACLDADGGSYVDEEKGIDLTYNQYEPTEKNTGYYISGFTRNSNASYDRYRCVTLTHYASTGSTSGKVYQSFGGSNIAWNSEKANLHDVKTITSVASNGTPTVVNVDPSKYVRYSAASKRLEKVLKSSEAGGEVYGLHFVNKTENGAANTMGDVGMHAILKAKNVSILGKQYEEYEMPVHTIDFHLENDGYITFLSGVYSGGTGIDSFFSLYQVVRDSETGTTISDLKRISKIYVNTQTPPTPVEPAEGEEEEQEEIKIPPYVYEYSDGTSSPGTKGALKFDTAVIGKSDLQSYLYYIMYFEIPVNSGEYALGAVPGANEGCYLLYLDIGSNGKENPDEIYSYSVTTISDLQSYPKGIDFAIAGITANGGDSMCVSVAAGKEGTIIFTISDSGVDVDGTTEEITIPDETNTTWSISTFTYLNSGCNVTGGAPPQPLVPNLSYSRTTYIKVISIDDVDGVVFINYYYFKVVDQLNEDGTIKTRTKTVTDPDTGETTTTTEDATDYFVYSVSVDTSDDDYDPEDASLIPNLNVLTIDYTGTTWEGTGGITFLVPTLDEYADDKNTVKLIDLLRTRDIVAILEKMSGKTNFDVLLPDMPWPVGTVSVVNQETGETETLLDESSIVYAITIVSENQVVIKVTVTTTTDEDDEVILAYTVTIDGTEITSTSPVTITHTP